MHIQMYVLAGRGRLDPGSVQVRAFSRRHICTHHRYIDDSSSKVGGRDMRPAPKKDRFPGFVEIRDRR